MSNELKDAHSKSGEEAKKMGSYISVAPADVMAKIASLPASDTKVLFFHASWCATCAATDKSFTEKGIQRAGVDVLKVDYDTSTDLKKKYGVTTQHTFVQVNSKGEMITKWLAGSVVELYKNIK